MVVFLVLRNDFTGQTSQEYEKNSEVVAVRLTLEAAESVIDDWPGLDEDGFSDEFELEIVEFDTDAAPVTGF